MYLCVVKSQVLLIILTKKYFKKKKRNRSNAVQKFISSAWLRVGFEVASVFSE